MLSGTFRTPSPICTERQAEDLGSSLNPPASTTQARRQKLSVSVVGVPKSIDNDVLFVDRTFGFDSAITAASEIIRNGWVEATSCAKVRGCST